jgi:hypothetical protein
MKVEMDVPVPADDTLVRYLLGHLPHPQAEELDERSVVDPEFAERLRAIEHDLADAYACGELSANDRLRWERLLGASSGGRQDLTLATALAARETVNASVRRVIPRQAFGLAAAAMIFFVAGAAYLLAPTRGPVVPAAAPIPSAQAAPPPAPPISPALVIALTLAAPRRDGTTVPLLQIPPGTTDVAVTLELEPTDFTRYAVSLRNLSTRTVTWEAPDVAIAPGPTPSLKVLVPASALPRGLFVFDVVGLGRTARDPIGSYSVRVKAAE